MSGQMWEPGHIHRTLGGRPGVMDYTIGEYGGGLSPRVEALAQMIRDGVGTCGVSDHVMDDVWTKFVVNCGGNLLAAITSWDTRELGLNRTARLRWALQDEAVIVGEHLGIRFGNIGGSVGVILTPEDIRQAAQGKRPDLGRRGIRAGQEIGCRHARIYAARCPAGHSNGGRTAERLCRTAGPATGNSGPVQPGPGTRSPTRE